MDVEDSVAGAVDVDVKVGLSLDVLLRVLLAV